MLVTKINSEPTGLKDFQSQAKSIDRGTVYRVFKRINNNSDCLAVEYPSPSSKVSSYKESAGAEILIPGPKDLWFVNSLPTLS